MKSEIRYSVVCVSVICDIYMFDVQLGKEFAVFGCSLEMNKLESWLNQEINKY